MHGTRFGRQMLRVEDKRLLTGKGRYTDNLAPDGLLHLVVLRAAHAHAEILSIDASEALAMPGVIAIYTGDDLADVPAIPFIPMFKRADGSGTTAPDRVLLARGTVRHVGQPVAAIVATTRALAEDAAELIAVEYKVLQAVTDMRAAIQPGAPLVCPAAPDNIAAEAQHGDAAATAAAFAGAAHVVTLDLVNQRLVAAPMERRNAIGSVEAGSGRSVLDIPSQSPSGAMQGLAPILGRPAEEIHVVVGDIGGGFGMKATLHLEEMLAAYAATKLGRPVKFVADRGEDFLASVHGRDNLSHAELALDADGHILALKVHTLANMGAYLAPVATLIPLALGPKVLPGTYHIPTMHLHAQAVLTHTMSTSAYRGAGRPEAIYIIERLMDAAAAQLGLDPTEIRRRNFVKPEAMPYKSAMGEVYDVGKFGAMLENSIARSDLPGFAQRKAAEAARGRLLGRGISSYIEWTGAYEFTETVDVTVTGEGRVIVHSATQAMGQGLETTYTNLVADKLGIDPDLITVIQGDTDLVRGPGSFASRSAFVGGSAVAHSAETWISTATSLAADALEASAPDIQYETGRFVIAGTDRDIGIFELADRQPERKIAIKASHTVAGSSWPNGCHICELAIDPETGATEITRYVTTDDVGTALNAMLVEGQVHGGIAQGVGQALLENCVYDANGELLSGSFTDYAMPRAEDFPTFDVMLDQSVPCSTNPLGVKGCGESGTVGSVPAVVNAVLDALRPLGVGTIDMPATPFAIWQAIQSAKTA